MKESITLLSMKETDYYNLMKGFESEEIEPMVGIFWYLPEEHRLFEVYASSLSQSKMVNGHTTYHKLHKTIWQAKRCRDKAKGKEKSVYYQDYTRIPRGRVFYDNGKFIVKVGSWYKQYEDELRELVEDAFNLPDDFVFEIGRHWELGHGWDESQLDDFFHEGDLCADDLGIDDRKALIHELVSTASILTIAKSELAYLLEDKNIKVFKAHSDSMERLLKQVQEQASSYIGITSDCVFSIYTDGTELCTTDMDSIHEFMSLFPKTCKFKWGLGYVSGSAPFNIILVLSGWK